jgi:hypothetical protein
MRVSDQNPATDSEYIERLTILRLDLEELLARLTELEDDVRHDENVARTADRDWKEDT